MTQRRPFRTWMVLWAVLQFALPTFATYADALLERESATAFAHAESRTDSSCRAVHSAECAFCQVVHRSAAPDHNAPQPPCEHEVSVPAAAFATQTHSADLEGRPGPRGPPAA